MNLVVNEMEEAPFVYKIEEKLRSFHAFMRDQVQPMVEKYGYPHIWVNCDELDNVDYFGYNHLNSRGVKKHTPMLIKKLRRHVFKNNFYPNNTE